MQKDVKEYIEGLLIITDIKNQIILYGSYA
jgi:hypothetical protein